MKNKPVLILFFILLFNCSPHENPPSTPSDLLKANLTSGNWTVGHYSHGGFNGIDDTANYTGYVLTFKSNGTIVATNNTETINGTYTIRSEKIDLYSETYLTLNFNDSPIFQNLNSSSWSVYGNTSEINLRIYFNDFLTLTK